MADMTLSDLAKKMSDIDVAMLVTRTGNREIAARPMAHDTRSDYDGVSYYFTTEDTGTVADIAHDPHVGLTFQGRGGIVGQRPFMMVVAGVAEVIRDREAFKTHWREDLTRWFARDIDTQGLVMLKITATRIHYWDGNEIEGEVVLV